MVTGPVCVPSLRHIGTLYFWEVEWESKRNGEREETNTHALAKWVYANWFKKATRVGHKDKGEKRSIALLWPTIVHLTGHREVRGAWTVPKWQNALPEPANRVGISHPYSWHPTPSTWPFRHLPPIHFNQTAPASCPISTQNCMQIPSAFAPYHVTCQNIVHLVPAKIRSPAGTMSRRPLASLKRCQQVRKH